MNQDQPSESSHIQPDIQIPLESGSDDSQLPAKAESQAVAAMPERRTESFPIGIVSAMELGRRPTNILSVLGSYFSEQLQDRQEKVDKLQDALSDEKVAHARIEERMAAGSVQSGTKLFSATLGGALFGIGIGGIDFGSNWARGILAFVGVVMIVFGCLPYRRGEGKS